jgi:hypothetical protein
VLCGDRWWWSQWFLWLTGLILIPGGLLLWGGLFLRRSRWHAAALLLPLIGGVEYVVPRWNPGHSPATGGVSILHWTAGPIGGSKSAYGEFIVGADPDLLIVEGARRAASTDVFRSWSAARTVLFRGPFLIASRFPVLQSRTIAWADDILLISFVTELPSGEPLDILIVDLPSDPARSRWLVVNDLHALMTKVESEPDMIIGDFNLTQTSWLLTKIREGYGPFWSRAGVGWGGTYPRAWPFYRLDHVLTPKGEGAVASITVIDPGCGRHRAQVIEYGGGDSR